MPQYAVIGTHPPDNCPMTNKAVREFVQGSLAHWPELEKEPSVKTLSWLHLDPSGQAHYLELNLHLVTPIEELVQKMEEAPTIY